jgi:hypothetical protein
MTWFGERHSQGVIEADRNSPQDAARHLTTPVKVKGRPFEVG